MSNDISNQITQTVTKCKYFSLALDETCGLKSMSQLAIFVRCVDENFNVFQDLLELSQLETTSTGKDIFIKIKECVDREGIVWEKINSVCTDGAPAMTGKINGCVALLKQFLGRELFSYHCIIHQEALCAKDMKFNDVIDPVVRCINYIRAKALHRRQFRVLFEEEINEFDIRGKLENTSPDISKYQTQIQLLLQSFENRFQDFEKDKNNILFFMNPFSITFNEIQKYSCNIQLEITEIQNHVSLKQIFTEIVSLQPQLQSSENLLKFWKLVPKEDYPTLCDLALKISSRFGSDL
ncbi:general transcription factor II-I repeat domain-containing protein 2B-like [Sipha flava]|uniref:General transcription factor II-I repeat domain-containing protein 2B-like n=1 Tax=Sipha flava TaxID=143950 RepID=A0A8B8FRJ6_9HEMI|nr:general transcription factor II-I repeat domain-containing protein 2B-like [Sipha flava]